MFKNLLLPTDGSATAAKAIDAGVALAKALGAKVTGYCALPASPGVYHGDGYFVSHRMLADFEKSARETAEKHLAKVKKAAEKAGVAYESVVTQPDSAYGGIIDAARKRKCDAIVMASRGRGGMSGLVLGSVTHKVLSLSKIPVVVYR